MIQGPQTVQRAPAGSAEHRTNPPSPAEPDLPSAAASGARVAEATSGLARTEFSTTDHVVTDLTKTGKARAIVQTQGLRAELVRAETMLQIARQAIAAIEIIYAGMQELAELALDEDLTEGERAILAAAFQDLKQGIVDIIEATVFDGVQILGGGDGPDGAFVIDLSTVDASGLPLHILIPAISVMDIGNGFEGSDLLTIGSALVVREPSEMPTRIFGLHGHMIEVQRASLQQIYAAEIDSSQSLSDHVGSFETPEHAEHLSQSVSDVVLAGGAVPFQDKPNLAGWGASGCGPGTLHAGASPLF